MIGAFGHFLNCRRRGRKRRGRRKISWRRRIRDVSVATGMY